MNDSATPWSRTPPEAPLWLSDLIPDRFAVEIECIRCERRGRYNLRRLLKQHGNVKLADLKRTLAKCDRADAANFHNRCLITWTWIGR